MDLATIGSVDMMAIANCGEVAVFDVELDKYIASLRRAFPAESWRTVKYYAERAWFAADLVDVSWDQVESRLESAWDRPVGGSPGARREAAPASAEYARWSVARRVLQEDEKAGRRTRRDPARDYGMHG